MRDLIIRGLLLEIIIGYLVIAFGSKGWVAGCRLQGEWCFGVGVGLASEGGDCGAAYAVIPAPEPE